MASLSIAYPKACLTALSFSITSLQFRAKKSNSLPAYSTLLKPIVPIYSPKFVLVVLSTSTFPILKLLKASPMDVYKFIFILSNFISSASGFLQFSFLLNVMLFEFILLILYLPVPIGVLELVKKSSPK